jgi:hypothetical protein
LRKASIEDLTARLIALNQVLSEYPVLRVETETERAIALGKVFSCGNVQGQYDFVETSWHRVLSSEGILIALAKPVTAIDAREPQNSSTNLWHPSVVLLTKDKS